MQTELFISGELVAIQNSLDFEVLCYTCAQTWSAKFTIDRLPLSATEFAYKIVAVLFELFKEQRYVVCCIHWFHVSSEVPLL